MSLIVFTHLFIAICGLCAASQFTPSDITVLAYVYDPWTPEPAVFGAHGTNWTEWELVRHAMPRFPGHLQPNIPLWGEIDTSIPATWDLLNNNALSHGIQGYLWDWYWWADAPSNPLLVRGLERGFLHAASSSKMKWGVMWANQDWADIFPRKRMANDLPMFKGMVDLPTWTVLSQYWIDKYFPLSNYLQVKDCPLVNIYLIDNLVIGLGGISATAAAFASFRQRALSAGIPCVHIQVQGFGARNLPKPVNASLVTLGVDSVTDYCPQHYEAMPDFPVTDYASYSASAIAKYGAIAESMAPVAYVPNFGVAWDPSPRTSSVDQFDNSGYPYTPVLQPTVAQIETALTTAADAVAKGCTDTMCFLTVYAYTEFSEGGTLFPTVRDGYGRLQAFQAVFGNRSIA